MEEISQLHNLNIEWGCITNLMDKISNIEGKIEGGWPQLVDMVADAMTEEGENKDPASAFFSLYQYMWRLYYRVKNNPVKRPFNQYRKDEGGKYWITNYTYATFKWARAQGFMGEIDNDNIKIPADKLDDKQRRALDRRCKETK